MNRWVLLGVVAFSAMACDIEVPIGRHDAGLMPCRLDAGWLGSYRVDSSFADCGRFVLDVGGVDNLDFGVQSLAVQPDGRILLAGSAGSASNRDFLAVRLLTDGVLDLSFGVGGLGVFDLGSALDLAEAISLEPDGKMVLAGVSKGSGPERAAVVRLLDDGALDPAFGVKLLGEGSQRTLCNGLVRLADGRSRCGGHGWNGPASDLQVFALQGDGAIETSFGSDGGVWVDFLSGDEFGGALVADAQGRLLVPGGGWNGLHFDFVLARLLPDGSPDPSFGAGVLPGRVSTDFSGGDDHCQSVVVQGDGLLLCSGSATVASRSIAALARYRGDGSLDTAFGAQGRLTLEWGPGSSANRVIELLNGQLLVAGKGTNASGDSDFAFSIIDPDGTERVSHFFDLGLEDEVRALVVEPSGDVLALGPIRGAGHNDFVLLRLTTRPEPPPGGMRLGVGSACDSSGQGVWLPLFAVLSIWFRRKSPRK